MLVLTIYLFTIVPKGFIPTEDTGQLFANTKAAQDISFDDMLLHQQKIVDILRKDPNIAALNSTVGASGPNASVNSGRINIRLKPRDRGKPYPPSKTNPATITPNAEGIIQALTPQLRRVPGIQAFLRAPAAIPIGGQGNAFGSAQVSMIYTPNNQYTVILELQPQYQRDPSAISMLLVSKVQRRYLMTHSRI